MCFFPDALSFRDKIFLECLANFLSGEGRLESFLEQTPPIDTNVSKAKSGLAETKRYLLLAANENDKQVNLHVFIYTNNPGTLTKYLFIGYCCARCSSSSGKITLCNGNVRRGTTALSAGGVAVTHRETIT